MSDQIDFDFEIYHPLDHSLFDLVTCNHWYGGTLRHIALEWDYRTGQEIRSWFWRTLNCRRGKHDMQPYWNGRHALRSGEPSGFMCIHCIYTSPC